jgi:alanine racemase
MKLRNQLAISPEILGQNIDQLRKICPKNEILFMVKANAYGHDASSVVEYCVEEKKISEFGVAGLEEALKLRNQLEDLEFDISIFSDVVPIDEDRLNLYLENRLLPVLSSLESLEFILNNQPAVFLPLQIKFNTGMNRLGISMTEVDEVIERLKKHGVNNVSHIMTHLANSFLDIKQASNQRQYANFCEIKRKFTDNSISFDKSSISNSGAIEQRFGLEETHVRPGLMLYGPSCLLKKHRSLSCWKGQMISSLSAKVISHYEVKKGDPVGYGGHVVDRDGRLVIVSLGYGDGLYNHFQRMKISVKGMEGQIVGLVNMDMVQILFPKEIESVINLSDDIVFWEHSSKSFYQFLDQQEVSPYEVFCGISSRVPRLFKDKDQEI